MKRALFAGTFDPPTLGHLDMIQRASTLCEELIVGIAINTTKMDTLFNALEREEMLKILCRSMPNVEVVHFSTLVSDYAQAHQVDFLIRGLRSFADLESEVRMALTNRTLSGIETIFLLGDEKYAHISSTMIRELGKFKGRLHEFVPSDIEDTVFKKLSKS